MTDRQTANPGQYKAVVSLEELTKMQNGEEFIMHLTRDDHPLTEGTPYNKKSVLPDELAEALCPGVIDPTPADAFAALNSRTAYGSSQYPGCYYRTVDGEQEWENPPMKPGEEYRTTKRHNGQPIYTKLIKTDTLRNASVDMGITGTVVSFHGNAFSNNGTTVDPFPIVSTTGTIMAIAYLGGGKIQICAFCDKEVISSFSAEFVIEYTK